MKMINRLILIVLILFPSLSFAATYTVPLAWDYDTPPADLAGFRLYVNDAKQPDIAPTARTYDYSGPLNDGSNSFSLTAFDTYGNESEPSEPLTINPPPAKVSGFWAKLISWLKGK